MIEKIIFLFCAISAVLAIPFPADVKGEVKADVDICSLPPVNPSPIACSGIIPRWTYNAKTEACEKFTYGGCFGTENLFKNEFACLSRCNKKGLEKRISEADTSNPCMLPKATGTCRAFIPSFFFDTATGECTAFTYTGCGGNANNFDSEEACDLKCNGLQGPVKPPPAHESAVKERAADELTKAERCSLPPVKTAGAFSCLAFIPSWTFNSTSGQCESFIYGGCGKTANLFESQDACNTACGPEPRILSPRQDTCLLPVVAGPCFGFFPRYAFVKEKNRCELFTYGGCQGNKNNFKTADECYSTCGGDIPNTTPECSQVKCPATNKRFIDRGCRPEYKGKACCPSRFVCPEEKSVQGTCRYRDAVYLIGEEIAQLNKDDGCKTGCKCIESDKHQGGATIKCNQIFCDEPMRPQQEGCVLVTPPGACCPTWKCPEKRPDQEKGPRNDICIFKGKEYLKGQSIPTGEPCRLCTCDDGFTGLDGPGCRDRHCVLDNRIGCVPVYTDSVCCPISYKCVNADELSQNRTRIIQIRPEPGKQGVTTLPMDLMGNREQNKPTVKSDICLLPKLIGPCRMALPSFYYDAEKGDCFLFQYGGCKGNANRFETSEACLEACRPESESEKRIIRIESDTGHQGVTTLPIGVTDDAKKSRIIHVPPQPGKVGVSTLPIAVSPKNELESRPAICLQPKQTGTCRAIITKFFFDSAKEKCVAFNFGGCEGNENQFDTLEECRKVCREPAPEIVDVCSLAPSVQGRCKAGFPSFTFYATTGTCESFIYGGCGGNGNRFESKEECEKSCINHSPRSGAPKVVAVKKELAEDKFARCKFPADVGLCRAQQEKFFYDNVDKECKTFNYGGCMGNANNFDTKQECISACQPDVFPEEAKGPRARARARARTSLPEEGVMTNVIDTTEPVCIFGNLTLKLGERLLDSDTPCDECVCSTPPELSCITHECPSPPNIESAICEPTFKPGQCCPTYSCVSANPPSINACQNVDCPAPPSIESAICQPEYNPGECCPASYSCVSANPPTINPCQNVDCPAPPSIESAICKPKYNPGECCPASYACVSANPPTINVCENINCPAPPTIESAICEPIYKSGECCPSYACASANPPTINVCQNVDCPAPPNIESAICEPKYNPGECCPASYSCVSANPPTINVCENVECPAQPNIETAICEPQYRSGECCPSYSCVSANPPSINVCQDVICDQEEEHCEVKAQESEDGSWLPPIGVCVNNTTSIPL